MYRGKGCYFVTQSVGVLDKRDLNRLNKYLRSLRYLIVLEQG